jgi:hypothetical protein
MGLLRRRLRGALANLSAVHRQTITGHGFFPHLIAEPFAHGLVVFVASAIPAALAALASSLRGSRRTDQRPAVDPTRRAV